MDKNKRTKLRDGIAMIITGVIAVLMVFGINVPVISDTVIGKVAYVIAFAISYAVNHYFNHNYSEEAKQSQELLDYLKEASKINEYVQHVDNFATQTRWLANELCCTVVCCICVRLGVRVGNWKSNPSQRKLRNNDF